jgi:predicted ester cyclase
MNIIQRSSKSFYEGGRIKVENTDNAKLYDRWMEMWNGNLDLANSIVDKDCVVHQAGSDGFRGPSGVVRMVQMGREPFSSIHFALEVGPIVDSDMLSARWTSRGIYRGGILGTKAPAGTEVEFGGIDIWRLKSGKIIEYWVSSDGLHLMAQLS